MLPPNWRFREIVRNNKPELILEHFNKNIWFRQYTFSSIRSFQIGDEIINKKTHQTGIIKEICENKIIIKKSRFEISIDTILEIDDWEKN